MLPIEIIAVGKLKNDPLLDVFRDYRRRITSKFSFTEIDAKSQDAQIEKLAERLHPSAAIVMLDERGKSLSSRDFAARLNGWELNYPLIQFVIGGADGLTDAVRKKATLLLSFGVQTWPHMLVRVMLLEQIYRAQQILAGHPYHRD